MIIKCFCCEICIWIIRKRKKNKKKVKYYKRYTKKYRP